MFIVLKNLSRSRGVEVPLNLLQKTIMSMKVYTILYTLVWGKYKIFSVKGNGLKKRRRYYTIKGCFRTFRFVAFNL